MQYRETDFDFVSRLMEHEGIGYRFDHTDGHHTLVLTDSTSLHTPTRGCESLSFIAGGELVRPDLQHISSWDLSREIQPGVYVHDDYDFERPAVELRTSKNLPRDYTPSDFEVYDYPGLYMKKPDGEQYAAVRIDELGSQFEVAHAKTNARGLTVGSLLTLEDHPRADQNREYLIVGADYDLLFEDHESLPDRRPTSYRCGFSAMPSSQQFRPRRQTRKPFVQGPQTAVVVGPANEEIFTDEHGRVKVQFRWDRRGKDDEQSSCFIRVSQVWAGKGWGAIHTPRVGHEVIVDFLEGDPDQPIIVGRVYNGTNVPPYTLPDHKTQSGVKSRSSLAGTPDNFNEIRFEDKKGQEEIVVHAERNLATTVEASESRSVGGDRSTTIGHDDTLTVKHDEKTTIEATESRSVGGDRSTTIGHDDTLTVKNDEKVTIQEGNAYLLVDGHNRVVVVNQQYHLTAKNIFEIADAESFQARGTTFVDLRIAPDAGTNYIGINAAGDIGINAATRVGALVGSNHVLITNAGIIEVKADNDISAIVGGNHITIKSGGQIEVSASAEVKIVVGGNSVKVDASGVTVLGSVIKLNC